MKLKAIVCDIFFREFCSMAAVSSNVIDAVFLEKGKHDKPTNLKKLLQDEIDRTPEGQYDAIVMLYGLCGKSVDGLVANTTKLVIPRTHDCIAVFLGSLDEYMRNFRQHPGTYYYTSGAWERGGTLGAEAAGDGEAQKKKLDEYIEKYGEENARYLLDMESSWTSHYTRAAFITYPGLDFPIYEEKTAVIAQEKGLDFRKLEGRLDLIKGLLEGQWDGRFVIAEPGQKIMATDDNNVMKSVAM